MSLRIDEKRMYSEALEDAQSRLIEFETGSKDGLIEALGQESYALLLTKVRARIEFFTKKSAEVIIAEGHNCIDSDNNATGKPCAACVAEATLKNLES